MARNSLKSQQRLRVISDKLVDAKGNKVPNGAAVAVVRVEEDGLVTTKFIAQPPSVPYEVRRRVSSKRVGVHLAPATADNFQLTQRGRPSTADEAEQAQA